MESIIPLMPIKPRWTIEDKDFWIDSFMTLLPAILAEVPNYDNDEKLITKEEYDIKVMDRVETCAKAADKTLSEMQFRFWDNARGNVEDKIRFGRGKSNRNKGLNGGRNRQRAKK